MVLNEIRKTSSEELRTTANNLQKELLSMRLKLSIGNDVKTHELKKVRKDIARILTILKERELGGK